MDIHLAISDPKTMDVHGSIEPASEIEGGMLVRAAIRLDTRLTGAIVSASIV